MAMPPCYEAIMSWDSCWYRYVERHIWQIGVLKRCFIHKCKSEAWCNFDQEWHTTPHPGHSEPDASFTGGNPCGALKSMSIGLMAYTPVIRVMWLGNPIIMQRDSLAKVVTYSNLQYHPDQICKGCLREIYYTQLAQLLYVNVVSNW